MRRRDFIVGLAGVAGWSSKAHAQSGFRRYRVGMLDTSPRELNPNFGALEQALRERGYIESQTSPSNIDRPVATTRASLNWHKNWCVSMSM